MFGKYVIETEKTVDRHAFDEYKVLYRCIVWCTVTGQTQMWTDEHKYVENARIQAMQWIKQQILFEMINGNPIHHPTEYKHYMEDTSTNWFEQV